jgi:hypothetical protein
VIAGIVKNSYTTRIPASPFYSMASRLREGHANPRPAAGASATRGRQRNHAILRRKTSYVIIIAGCATSLADGQTTHSFYRTLLLSEKPNGTHGRRSRSQPCGPRERAASSRQPALPCRALDAVQSPRKYHGTRVHLFTCRAPQAPSVYTTESNRRGGCHRVLLGGLR